MSSKHHLIPVSCRCVNDLQTPDEYSNWQNLLTSLRHTEHRASQPTRDPNPIFTAHPQWASRSLRDLAAQNAKCSAAIQDFEASDDRGYVEEDISPKTLRVSWSIMGPVSGASEAKDTWTSLQAVAHRLNNFLNLERYAHFDKICRKLRDLRPGDSDLQACVQMMQVVKMSKIKQPDDDFDDIEKAIREIMVSDSNAPRIGEEWGYSTTIMASSDCSRLMLELLLVKCWAAWYCGQWKTLEVGLRGLFQLLSTNTSQEFAMHAGMAHCYQAHILLHLSQGCRSPARANRLHRQQISHLEKGLAYFRQDSSADSAKMYYCTHLKLARLRLETGDLERVRQHLKAVDDFMASLSMDGRFMRINYMFVDYSIFKARLHFSRRHDAEGALAILLKARILLDGKFPADRRTWLMGEISAYQAAMCKMKESQVTELSDSDRHLSDSCLSDSGVDSEASEASGGMASSDMCSHLDSANCLKSYSHTSESDSELD